VQKPVSNAKREWILKVATEGEETVKVVELGGAVFVSYREFMVAGGR